MTANKPPLKLFAEKYEDAELFSTKAENSDTFVKEANQFIDEQWQKDANSETNYKGPQDAFFHALATFLSRENIKQKNGGPFGAVIVRYEGGLDENGVGIGKPEVIGVGANHVFPDSDPTAHAEMVAYRDAAQRTDSSDLSNAVLFTSCECCPMCLGIANGSGIGRISYSNDRVEAAEVAGFSDELQYQIAQQSHEELMTSVNQLEQARQQELKAKLGDHDAVILDKDGEVYATGKADTENDPTMIGSLAAVRAACQKAGSFTLPEGCTLVSREKPHLSGLIAADWSRILRDRDTQHPNDPEKDSKTVDPQRIIHIEDSIEQVRVTGQKVNQDAEITYEQPSLADDDRAVTTERYNRNAMLRTSLDVFERWRDGTAQGAQVKY